MSTVINGNGSEWFGKLSDDAVLSRVGMNYAIVLGKMLTSKPKDDQYSLEKYYCAANVHFDGIISDDLKQMWFSQKEKEQYLVNTGDLLIVEGGAGAGGCSVVTRVDDPIYIQNSIMIVRGKNGNSTVFLKYVIEYLVKGGYVDVVCNKATIPHFTKDKLSLTPFPLFSVTKQQRIAHYLDRKCAEIDSVISKTKATIEQYKSLKQSVITQAVTKGIRPDRPMKDSGIEWIGEIPQEWSVVKMKHLGRCRNGLTYSPENVVDEESGTLVLRSSNIKDGKLIFSDNVFVNNDIREELMVKQGDILICSRNGSRSLIGKNAIIPKELVATFGAFMMVFRCATPEYVRYILSSDIFSYYLGTFLTSTINQLTADNFNNMQVVYCQDEAEQTEIISFLDRKCSEIDRLIAAKEQLLTELESYKKSVIYEYVTGKKEV